MMNPKEELVRLLEAVDQMPLPATSTTRRSRVLLTGGTGFLGLHILSRLADDPHVTAIVVLSRERSVEEIRTSLKERLEEGRLWKDGILDKVKPVIGDPSRHNFGMQGGEYRSLSVIVDMMIHVDGTEDITSTYADTRSAIPGIQSALQFCSAGSTKKLLLTVTSFYSFPAFLTGFGTRDMASSDPSLYRPILESDMPQEEMLERFISPGEPGGGLPWAHLVIEKGLRHASDLGHDVIVCRVPPLWLSSSIMSFASKSCLYSSLMWNAYKTGTIPEGVIPSLTPVNVVSQLLVGLITSPKRPEYNLYHLVDSRPLPLSTVVTWSYKMGSLVHTITEPEFLETCNFDPEVAKVINKFGFFNVLDISNVVGEVCLSSRRLLETLGARTSEFAQLMTSPSDGCWGSPQETFENGITYLLQCRYFDDEGKAAILDPLRMRLDAMRDVQLQDFGEFGEFLLEGMTRFFEAVKTESSVVYMLKAALVRTFRQFWRNLLLMANARKNDPEIEKQEIEKPLFILGLNRTGTTFLQHLLACDSVTRSATLAELMLPYGELGEWMDADSPLPVDQNDIRVKQCRALSNQQIGLTNEFMSLHLRRSGEPEEDTVPFEMACRSWTVIVGFIIPTHRAWLCNNNFEEIGKCYAFHRYFMQNLQRQKRQKRWIFKMPFHTLALDALLKVYPDAKFVALHRDPVAVVNSWCALESVIHKLTQVSFDPKLAGRSGLEALSTMGQKLVEFQNGNEGRIINLSYEYLIADPMRGVMRLYEQLGWELSRETTNKMWSYMVENRKLQKYANAKYDLSLVGLTVEMIRDAFQDYEATFGTKNPLVPVHTIRERFMTIQSLVGFFCSKRFKLF